MAVLTALRHDPGYSYDICRRLRNAGLADAADSSLSSSIRRRVQSGCLTTYVVPSDEGPHRKYCALNAAGRAQLERSTKVWRGFVSTMDDLLNELGEAA